MFKTFIQNQSLLLPPSFSDYLGENHPSVILSEFVKSLDTRCLFASYKNQNGGASAFNPVMLFSVLVYSYLSGVFSSREIARKLKQDIAFMFLSGNNTPDFRTISRFRAEKEECIRKMFEEVVLKAQELGLVNFDVGSLDGTKIYASASKNNNHSLKAIKEKIRLALEEASRIDDLEDKEFNGEEDNIPEDLKTKAGRERRRKELAEKKQKSEDRLEKLQTINPESEETSTNLTDPDSKLMLMKKKDWANGYNVQNVTQNRIILSYSIFNSSSDTGTLIQTLKDLKEKFSRLPKILLADKGYSSSENYEFCKTNQVNAYIPPQIGQVDLSNYTYDQKTDTYQDKVGRIFVFKQFSHRKDGNCKRGRPKKEEATDPSQFKSMIYEHKDSETGIKKYLSISKAWQDFVAEQKKKLSTLKGRKIYKQRMWDVEGPFGNIKQNLGFTSFRLRGCIGVRSEWGLVSIAHNIQTILGKQRATH